MSVRPIEVRPPAARAIEASTFRLVTNLAFEPSGVTVEFISPQDVKENGVMLAQSLFVPHGDQYDDEIDAVIEAVHGLLSDVLDDLPCMPAKEPKNITDDDRGMGM